MNFPLPLSDPSLRADPFQDNRHLAPAAVDEVHNTEALRKSTILNWHKDSTTLSLLLLFLNTNESLLKAFGILKVPLPFSSSAVR